MARPRPKIRAKALRRILWIAVLTCCGGALAPTDMGAQTQEHFITAAADPHIIGGDLKLGILLAEQALGMLQSTRDPEELKRAAALTMRSYLQWNRAAGGVQHLQARRTFEDPLLRQTAKIIDAARSVTSQAYTRIHGAAAYEHERAVNIAMAIELLQQAVALAQQAMDLV